MKNQFVSILSFPILFLHAKIHPLYYPLKSFSGIYNAVSLLVYSEKIRKISISHIIARIICPPVIFILHHYFHPHKRLLQRKITPKTNRCIHLLASLQTRLSSWEAYWSKKCCLLLIKSGNNLFHARSCASFAPHS